MALRHAHGFTLALCRTRRVALVTGEGSDNTVSGNMQGMLCNWQSTHSCAVVCWAVMCPPW